MSSENAASIKQDENSSNIFPVGTADVVFIDELGMGVDFALEVKKSERKADKPDDQLTEEDLQRIAKFIVNKLQKAAYKADFNPEEKTIEIDMWIGNPEKNLGLKKDIKKITQEASIYIKQFKIEMAKAEMAIERKLLGGQQLA